MNPFRRMTAGKALIAKCKDCIYDDANGGTWRQQVTLCSATDCPLWDHRPVSDRDIGESVLKCYDYKGQPFGGPEKKFRDFNDFGDQNG